MKKLIKVYMPDKLIDDLKLISALEGCKTSFIIRTVVQDYVNYYLHRYSDNIGKKTTDE